MKDYFWNVVISAVVCFIIAVVTFLIGNEAGQASYASAMTAGALSGVTLASSYTFGKLVAGEGWNKVSSIRFLLMLVFRVAAGLFGGWTMTL